ncbi:uncharacterized protein PHACADRAFT_168768 [Phanerochaete carnosa HHB-10118-sp]|uniref:F-box domain-containing protein n=1 Tax=Phanerochaete carnosa (strain HHB-10118-sp) TaxID=650164 RepID=K5WPH3_PHACS|nr:uncharacterized protein PHACADRAFT_168768 [Phanerochaete carnosa HHB-10118-sp]EKM61330.1 hypothetical protein PHACADRAFT_168768 [Phanerochaete carnosa HHB-10118-sp]
MSRDCRITDLPAELLHEIFEHLWEDKVSLSSCTLVCKEWSDYSRPALFREITVAPELVPEMPHPEYPELEIPDWTDLARRFDGAPHLAAHVQILHVEGGELPMERSMLDEFDEVECEVREDGTKIAVSLNYCFVDLAALLALAQALPGLTKVTLDTLIVKSVALPHHQPALIETLEMNDVGTVKGETPFIIFAPDANKIWPESFPFEPSVPTCKWTIRGEPNGVPIIRGLAASSLGRLTSLVVDLRDEYDLLALNAAFKSFGPQFKELTLDLWDATWVARPHVVVAAAVEEAWNETFTLAPCEGLEKFVMHFKLGYLEDSVPILESVAHLLSTFPPTIRTVRLIIDFAFFIPPDVAEMPWSSINWALKNLEKVTFTIVDEGDRKRDGQILVEKAISSQLSDIGQRLHIEFIG